MKVNQQKYDPDNTYALMNGVGPQAILDAYEPLMAAYEDPNSPARRLGSTKYGPGSTLESFKRLFGRQQITVNYSRRWWIWTFTSDDGKATMHCLVNSQQGLTWEYNRATSDVNALVPLMNEIIEKLTGKRTKA